jgi:hypothetical protein
VYGTTGNLLVLSLRLQRKKLRKTSRRMVKKTKEMTLVKIKIKRKTKTNIKKNKITKIKRWRRRRRWFIGRTTPPR